MNLDVLINSCSRPDILEVSINTFRRHIKTRHKLRYIILEDKVEDPQRQALGKKWIEKNKSLFDEIHYSEKRLGPGFFFAPIVGLCKTPYFLHLEDDNEFFMDINIDPIIELMKRYNNVLEIILRRGTTDKRNNPVDVVIDGIQLTEFELFSVATGIFNTNLVKQVFDKIGWATQMKEAKILKPTSNELMLKKYTLGFNGDYKHYNHVGPSYKYIKGAWR